MSDPLTPLDDLDRALVLALRRDGRAAFSTLAAELGVSEQTVARRYRRLRSEQLIRVVAVVNPYAVGWHPLQLRLRTERGTAPRVGQALALRPDVLWLHQVSGSHDLSVTVYTRTTADRDALVLEHLPQTRDVLSVEHQLILRMFAMPDTWQTGVPRGGDHPPDRLRLDDLDERLLAVLARDARTGLAALADQLHTTPTTVRRRIAALREARAVMLMTEVDPALFGYGTEALLWLTVHPAHLEVAGSRLAAEPAVRFASATTGAANLIAGLAVVDPPGLYDFLTHVVGRLPGVTQAETTPMLRTIKRAGLLRVGRRLVEPGLPTPARDDRR
ncbi:DNA-binding transcriptional regulator, Lrp family [Streptoalloteichus tenebrarius]|uniref:DNA-binding transcriptional regulator, Lrp family n=1 Tax=Streptoalloteichus tenebrarius (strain ATCC 17920 / DSM 40477 / JCM 4838 / CBS 697.72 / NBRC 16177 / NCIMB 11028 / NRRL B-12390 / A12253. 1 / ISP 5477) TaxID=1933 RepID=A0ABT1HUE4_STRSD|nr:Lrp/AsnC family transcriptional regulator [Streptoalloteichus tenebrarius]MCP2259116.1 DNA-binding transcriptional regulator, Lrp family [Streptoalloteichus tenebrarius]BFE99558.1 Lrp/AsnC family transcriptional regulator [Streptoalloteichus tenebrarius]